MYGNYQVRLGGTWTRTIGTLIGVNVAIFLLQSFSPGPFPNGLDNLSLMFGLIPGHVFPDRIYTLLTYAFLHGGPMHLFFNMLTLYFFGGDLQLFMGLKRFLILYFGAALSGGILGAFMPHSNVVIIGASGALFGILAAYAVYFPQTKVLLFFIIPIKIWVLVLGFMALSVYFIAVGGGGNVAHLAHLGGAIFGLLYVGRFWRIRALASDLKYKWRRRRFRRIQ